MGLDAAFLSMLTASVQAERRTGKDQWGNETYSAATTEKAFIDTTTFQFGTGTPGEQKDKRAVGTTPIIMDAVGISVGDRITFDGVPRTVTEVETIKDEFGNDLFQNVTVENQKKG